MSVDTNTIEQAVTVEAPADVVFGALTDAEQLARWFPTKVESDARTGGKFVYSWEFANAEQNGSQQGEYLEVVANQRVSYTWQAGEVPTTVDVTLKEAAGATEVRLVHSGFGTGGGGAQLREMHDGPWSFYMANRKSYLEQGADHRSEAISQITY
jgi:uncharacterized protein YndB with AHSA1/START domain